MGSTVGELRVGELWLGGGILRSMACGWDVASWRSEVGILRVGGLAPCRSEICGLGLGAWGLPFAIWGWGLRFGRHDVACCLRFGPESGLGFRIWGGWGLGAGGLPFAVLAGVWGLRLGFAARGLQLAVWRLRFGAGIRGMGLVRDTGNWGLGAGAQFWED